MEKKSRPFSCRIAYGEMLRYRYATFFQCCGSGSGWDWHHFDRSESVSISTKCKAKTILFPEIFKICPKYENHDISDAEEKDETM